MPHQPPPYSHSFSGQIQLIFTGNGTDGSFISVDSLTLEASYFNIMEVM